MNINEFIAFRDNHNDEVYINPSVNNTNVSNINIEFLKNTLSNIFDESEFDIYKVDTYYKCIIKLPDTVVDDTFTAIKYTANNLWLEITLNPIHIINIRLHKTVWDQFELKNYYMFSHANTNGSLCHGSNTPIEKIYVDMCNNLLDIDKLSTYLLNILSYLSHESWSGTPYQYYSNMFMYNKIEISDFKFELESFLDSSYFKTFTTDHNNNLVLDKDSIKAYIDKFNTSKKTLCISTAEGLSEIMTEDEFDKFTNNISQNFESNLPKFKGNTLKHVYKPISYDEYLERIQPSETEIKYNTANIIKKLDNIIYNYNSKLTTKIIYDYSKERNRIAMEATIAD